MNEFYVSKNNSGNKYSIISRNIGQNPEPSQKSDSIIIENYIKNRNEEHKIFCEIINNPEKRIKPFEDLNVYIVNNTKVKTEQLQLSLVEFLNNDKELRARLKNELINSEIFIIPVSFGAFNRISSNGYNRTFLNITGKQDSLIVFNGTKQNNATLENEIREVLDSKINNEVVSGLQYQAASLVLSHLKSMQISNKNIINFETLNFIKNYYGEYYGAYEAKKYPRLNSEQVINSTKLLNEGIPENLKQFISFVPSGLNINISFRFEKSNEKIMIRTKGWTWVVK